MRDSVARQPIPAVVLIVADSDGTPIVRKLTDERGAFRMQLPAGARRLQLLRIGFRPRDVTLPAPVDGVIALDLSMRMIPTLLEPVRVLDSPNCPRRDDRAAAFALWDQARSALLAAVVARETEKAVIKRLHFDRQLTSDGFTPLSQVVHVDSSAGARPFVATHQAAEFIERGFVDDSANVAVFNGPDADVMLDDAFPRGYCFRLADADRDRPHQIGLAFEAASHKRGRVDVEGRRVDRLDQPVARRDRLSLCRHRPTLRQVRAGRPGVVSDDGRRCADHRSLAHSPDRCSGDVAQRPRVDD